MFILSYSANNTFLTYFVQKIEVLGNPKITEKSNFLISQKIYDINNIISDLIKINLQEKHLINDIDFKLNEIKLILKNYINLNFVKFLFQNICVLVKDLVHKKIYIPHKLDFDKKNKQIKIQLDLTPILLNIDLFVIISLESPEIAVEGKNSNDKMEIDENQQNLNNITEEINKISLTNSKNAVYLNKEQKNENYILINFSHKILQKNPLIIVKNQKIKYNLLELNSINFKNIIIDKINEYQEIIFIWSFCSFKFK